MSEFDNLEGFGAEAEVTGEADVTVDTTAVADGKNEKRKEAARELSNRIKTDAEYMEKRFSRSKDLRVINVLGFGKSGSLKNKTDEYIDKAVEAGTVKVLPADSEEDGVVEMVDGVLHGTAKLAGSKLSDKYIPPFKKGEPRKGADGKANTFRRLANAPENVGYIVKNVSDTPIEYTTTLYTQDETGKFVGNDVKKNLMPNEEIAISRANLTKLTLRDEFNLTLENGTIIAKTNAKSVEELFTNPYFQFSRESGMDVNSPEVKKLIHDTQNVNGETVYVVKDEYIELFGYLNNKEEKAPKAKRAKANVIKPNNTEITAHYLRTIAGMM